jgi:antirestriction protein
MELRIYVACLAAYNNGSLHGAWIEASSDVEEMQGQVSEMLARSPVPEAEEYAIHDYELPVNIGEYAGLQAVADIAEFMEEAHDDDVAKAALGVTCGDVKDARDLLEEYCGHFDTLRELGENYADDCLEIPDHVQPYFDYEAYGRDLSYDMQEHNGHYFWSR